MICLLLRLRSLVEQRRDAQAVLDSAALQLDPGADVRRGGNNNTFRYVSAYRSDDPNGWERRNNVPTKTLDVCRDRRVVICRTASRSTVDGRSTLLSSNRAVASTLIKAVTWAYDDLTYGSEG
ncbi:hypothetical protein KZZ52_41630 [Dactylosporangium sp. AC04546]|uniref:hypothetical protein n=1 Tax=Dactylosporangium sp. AC04546 TaxID=2862460 RepID=UPI001EDED84D|nr:hypothetical protein [Dactylosporangium sp. AC04546]WVK80428.1 hypothetical protein KZZ52_41630 [Dactylosporangium sp. AC04546]